MRSMKMPSGVELILHEAPFADAKALYQAVLEEAKLLRIDDKAEIDANFWKDLFCVGFSSKKIELALKECMKRATYNGKKIDDGTFEPVEARDDYFTVCFEVAKENILPFTKSLSQQYGHILGILKNSLA